MTDNRSKSVSAEKHFKANGLYISVYFDQDVVEGVLLHLVNRAPENRGAELEV